MAHFLRKICSCNRKSLLRVVAVSTVGSALLYPPLLSNSETTASLSIPSSFSDSVSWPWRVPREMLYLPEFVPLGHHDDGSLPNFSSRISAVPAKSSLPEEASGKIGGKPKCCSNCLGRDTFANAAASVGPAVVNISTSVTGFSGLTLGIGVGSGTIINSDGTILTCAHLFFDSPGIQTTSLRKVKFGDLMKAYKYNWVFLKVSVTLQDGRAFEGTLLNADTHSDVAIVKINSKYPLPFAKLGHSSKLRPGDWVLAMGCPLSLQNTVTTGTVSCMDRKSSDLGLGGARREFVQTDCAINHGNSGGPLVNIDGEVIGINIFKLSGADGISFSVPIDSIAKIMDQFKKSGRVVRPWIGLKMIDLNHTIISQLREINDTFPDVNKGILVPMVTPGSPADRAGFRPGDVVVEFDGKPVDSIKQFIEVMGEKVGAPLKVVVNRAKDGIATLIVVPEEANSNM